MNFAKINLPRLFLEKEGNVFTVIIDMHTILILLEAVAKPIFRSEVDFKGFL